MDTSKAELASGGLLTILGSMLGLIQLADASTWLDAAKQVGVPAVALGAVFVGLYRAGAWVGQNLLKPMLKTHQEFVAGVKASTDRQAKAAEDQAAAEAKQVLVLSALGSAMTRMEEEARKDRAEAARDRATTRLTLQRLDAILATTARGETPLDPGRMKPGTNVADEQPPT